MALPSDLVIAVMPHLIPPPTIANGDLERAETEPLADGRDETIYLICSHPRIRLEPALDDGAHPVVLAHPHRADGIGWPRDSWWARIRLPSHAAPSAIPWAVIDTSLDWAEGLPRRDRPDAADPDGDEAENRADLLGWIYDRHLERDDPPPFDRGTVDGGSIDFRLEYVGLSGVNALRRAAGAHHKVPRILGRVLLYEPHRLVYVLPCEIRAVLFEHDDPSPDLRMRRLDEAADEYRVGRRLLIETAEHALIALGGTEYNRQNAVRRVFPDTSAGDKLRAQGARRVRVGFWGLPPRVRIQGRAAFEHDSTVQGFEL